MSLWEDLNLTGRTAVITGASRGIGLAAAQALAGAGANVVLTSRSQEAADAAAAQVNGAQVNGALVTAASVTGSAVGFEAHATDTEAAQRCVSFAVERFGRLDILVNNAGTNVAYGPMIDQDHERFSKMLETNLWAPVLWTSLAVRAWMGQHGGSIVNTASIGGLSVEPNLGVYNATKAALIHVTRQTALELGPKVRVNAIAPGVVRTRLAGLLWQGHEQELNDALPLGRIGEPDDIGRAIAFLASDAASWITGETLVIDGGALLGDTTAMRRQPAGTAAAD